MSLQTTTSTDLYETFLKIVDITISDTSIHTLEEHLSSIITILNPSHRSTKHKETLHEFIQKGHFIQLLQHLFSNYSLITAQWNDHKRSTLIFTLILSPQIPPHVIIDCIISLWKGFVAPHIDTEQPSYSIKYDDYTMIANDIISLTQQLLSSQSHLMILLSDWGTKILDNTSSDLCKYRVDPHCEQNIRCIVSVHHLFAPYFYLYRDYFRSLNNTSFHTDLLYKHYKFFDRKCFIKYLIETSFKIVIEYSADIDNIIHFNNNKHVGNLCKGIAIFCSVLIRIGYVDILNKRMLHHIKQCMESSGKSTVVVMYSILIECIAKLPGFDKWFESFLMIMSNDEYHNISCTENITFMMHLLKRILKKKSSSSEIEYLLSHKLIIKKRLSLHTLDYIVALLNYLNTDTDLMNDIADDNSDDGHHSIMIETITDIGNIWSRDTFALGANYDKQQYITRALVLLIQFILERLTLLNKVSDAPALIPFLFKGVKTRFSSDIVEVRNLAMFVAQQYAKVYPNADSLHFGVDLSNVFRVKNCIFKCCDLDDIINIIKNSTIDYNFKHILLLKHSETSVHDMKNDEVIDEDRIDIAKYAHNEDTIDKSWLNEMRKHELEADDENIWSTDSDDEDTKNDDDDDLEAYSLSDGEEDLRKVPLPSYIRKCWDLLNAKQKPDETESGLIAAARLIRNNPSDLKNVAVGLCRTLLHLQNEYNITNFAIHKRNALVSLIVVCPEQILSYLPFQLYTKQWSVGVKLEILTVLVDAAREMGNLGALNKMYIYDKDEADDHDKIKAIEKNDTNETDLSIISGHQSTSEKERWKIIDARVAIKTKRWASKPRHIALKENKFAKYATKFMYPILNGYNENEALLMEFPVLNTRILFALGCCVECSGVYGVDTVDIAKDIFELILSTYYGHKLPEVRRTSMFVLSRILLHVPSYVLKEQSWFVSEMDALVQNLFDMASNDSDYSTRDLSKLCLTELKQLFG